VTDSDGEGQAYTPWGKLSIDLIILVLAVVVPITSLIVDLNLDSSEWFQRSGALMVLCAGLLGYRSLTKHYQKFFNNMQRGYALKTSRNQTLVDMGTLIVLVLGTVIWGYGDKIF
jgi:hypothetical protein